MFLARLSHNSVVIISSISLERRLYRNQTLNLLIWSLADTFRWRWPIFVLVTYFTLFRKLSIFILESDNPSRKTWESNVEYVLLCVSYFVWYKDGHETDHASRRTKLCWPKFVCYASLSSSVIKTGTMSPSLGSEGYAILTWRRTASLAMEVGTLVFLAASSTLRTLKKWMFSDNNVAHEDPLICFLY